MRNRILQILTLLLTFFTCVGLAQEDRATVTGTVTDPTGATIPDALIEINSAATGFRREIKTNDSGAFLFPGLQIGTYDVAIHKDGFRTAQYPAFQLAVGQIRTINAQLQIASSAQEVLVVAEAEALDQTTSKVAGVIEASQVANLPINGRAWTALMALVPGAMDSGGGTQGSIRFAGRAKDDTNYRFDGVDASGISAQSPATNTRLQISTEAIAEFKVDTALYGADTGGSAGGQVEVISKSGSNAFHGGLFEYLRNDKLNSRTPFDGATLPPLRLNQFGGSFGGRIIKDRTFFFTTYEGLRQRTSTTLIGNVPSDAFRATVLAQSPALATLVNAFPRATRPLAGSSTTAQYVSVGNTRANEDSGLFRIDHKISDSTNLSMRYNIDMVELGSPSGNLRDSSVNSTAPMNGVVTLTHMFSPSTFNSLQFGMNRLWGFSRTSSFLYDSTGVFNSVNVTGWDKLGQGGVGSVRAPTTYTIKDDFTWTHGIHTVKSGVEIKKVIYTYSQSSENALVYASPATFAANQLDQVNLIGGVPTHGLSTFQYFGYIQDTMKVRRDLTMTVGLRYEFYNVFHEKYGRALPFDLNGCGGFCPQGSAFYFPQKNNLEPRLSLAWSPKALGGKTVIRAGSGFYKGPGQLGDLNAPSDNFAQRLSLSSASFPGLSYPADPFYAAAANQAVTPRSLPRDIKVPTLIQWGLQLQTALPGDFILDTGYIGYHGYHQFTRWYINGLDPKTGLRPYPGFGPIDMKKTDSNNHFHAWQTSLKRRFQGGLSFSANYMWSHPINDGSSGGGETVYPQINTCRACDTASSDADIRHTFSMNAIYQLPFGKGAKYFNQGRLSNAALGGWEISTTGTFRTGVPVNVTLTRTAAAVPDGLSLENGASYQRPNLTGLSLVPDNQSINNWINAAAFVAPASGTYGNAGRNLVRGPRFMQNDVSVSRDFRLNERYVLAFRAEGFNIWNRAQFGNPAGNFSNANFGRITTTVNGTSATGSGTPRQFQLAMRLRF